MLWSLRYHLGRSLTPSPESLMSCYEVWDITWVAPFSHDWNLWCHVLKFDMLLGWHPFAMVGIFDVMLWSLRYHLGCTLWPHTGDHFVNLLAGLSRGQLALIISSTFTTHGDFATFVVFVTLVNRRILKSWNYKNTSLLTSGGRVLIYPVVAIPPQCYCHCLSNQTSTIVGIIIPHCHVYHRIGIGHARANLEKDTCYVLVGVEPWRWKSK